MLGAVVAEAHPVAIAGDQLTLAFGSSAQFFRKKAEESRNRAIVAEALRSLTGARWRLSYELREVPDARGAEEAGERSEEELLRRFIEEFDAEEIPGDWQSGSAEEKADGHHEDAHTGEPELREARVATGNEKGA